MDELSIKIIMILFPGIITTMLLDKITEHKPWDNFKNVAALNRQISEGFNLKVANQSPPPRPTTQPVSHKKK